MIAAHLLALFSLFLVVFDQVLIFRLKQNSTAAGRVRTYLSIMAGLWVGAIWTLVIMGPKGLWYVALSPGELKWTAGQPVMMILAVACLAAILAPIMAVRKPKAAALIRHGLERLQFIMPQSQSEQIWWALLSISAGICEECIFRSFLFRYLHSAPWHLSVPVAIAIACVVFALGHLYQGALAATFVGVLGALFFVFFLGTGNLLVSIVLHALADLRVLLLLPESRGQSL